MHDMREDFKHNVGILFWEFYDSFFELFDNLVQAKNKFEYLDILSQASDVVLANPWLAKHKHSVK